MGTRRTSARSALRWASGLFTLLTLLTIGLRAGGQGQKAPWPNLGEDPLVTPVSGPSWLTHLGVAVGGTRLGQGSSELGPSDPRASGGQESLGVRQHPTVTGHDLYRLNCQACHTAEGKGVPPEIRSLLGPVQGSSLELVREQLQIEGAPTAAARAKAQQAHTDLVLRIRKGGQRMPSRNHLQEPDIKALFAYLTQLAGTPHPEKSSLRTITWARLGEHTVKGTCHICHDAVGPPPTPQALDKGAVPSLAALVATKPVAEFVRKARSGAPVSSADVRGYHRGRMPVFSYLRAEEIAAAYMYLATYPPQAASKR